MRTKTLFIIVFLLIPFICLAQSSSDACEPPEIGPPPDNADENYSYNIDGILDSNNNNLYHIDQLLPFIGIFKYINTLNMDNLLEKLGKSCFYVDEKFNPGIILKYVNILLIPTGGLFGKENDSTFKTILEQYVSQGGTIIVFAQQYGKHVDSVVPLPEGETLKTYGWREDQSCLRHSCYYTGIHPVVSSSTSERVHVGVDGNLQCQMFDVKCQKLNV